MPFPFLNSNKYSEGYKNGKVSFPDNSLPKDNDYFVQAATAIGGMYCNNLLTFGLDSNGTIGTKVGGLNYSVIKLRNYGNCRQSVTHLADELDPCDGDNKRMWGISWQPRDFYTKFRTIAKAKILQYGFKPSVICNDELGIGERDEMIAKEKLKINPRAKATAQAIGADVESDFETNQDVEDFADLGGFQLDIEIGVHDAVQETILNSGFEVIDKMLVEDVIDIGYCMATVEADLYTKKPIVKYADIATSFFTPSVYYDHRDTTLAGKFEKMSIADVRVYLTKEYDEEKAEDILRRTCSTYQGWGGGNKISAEIGARDEYFKHNNTLPYNHFSVNVMTAWFVASDVQTFVNGLHHKYGNAIYDKVNTTAKLKPVDIERGKSIDKKIVQNCYRVRWIVGTEYVFDCGLDHAIVREGETGAKRAIIPCVIYGSQSPSMTERVIDSIDDAQRAVFKMRHTFKNMPPLPLISVDLSALLESIEIGGAKMSYKDLLEEGRKTGVFAYMSKNEFGDPNGASNKKPVNFEAQNFIAEVLNLNNLKLQAIDEIRQVIGINDVSDGTNTSGELAVGVAEGANMATNNALYDNVDARKTVRIKLFNLIGRKYLSAVAAGDISGKYFTNNRVRQYKLSPSLADRSFAFSFTVLPTEERKQAMYQELAKMSQMGQIDSGDYMAVVNMLADDDVRKAEYYLSKASKKASQQAHQQAIQVQQAQGQANGDAAVQAEQAKGQTFQMQASANMELEKMKQAGMMEQIKAKGEQDRILKQMEIDAAHIGIGLTAAVTPPKSQSQ